MKLSIKVMCVLLIIGSVKTEDCLEAADDRDVPFYPPTTSPSIYLPSRTEAIMESYKFHCHGNITVWWLYISAPSNPPSLQNYSLSFQVWRQASGFETSGCYILVGQNTFNQDQVGSLDGGLVRAMPSEEDYIAVSPGDMVGIYATDSNNIEGKPGPRIFLDDSYTNETIWYHVNTPNSPLIYGSNPCYFSVGKGSDRSLSSFTNKAPILSVNMEPQTPFPSPSSTMAVPATNSWSTITAAPTLSIYATATPTPPMTFQLPTTEALKPAPFIWWMWFIIGAAVVLFLFLLLFLLIIIIILADRRKKRKSREKESLDRCSIITPYAESVGNLSEPIYAEIDVNRKDPDAAAAGSQDIEVVGIEVVANESYAMLASNSLIVQRYGSLQKNTDPEQLDRDRT